VARWAFGLPIVARFPLPELGPDDGAEHSQALVLTMVPPAEVRRRFSGQEREAIYERQADAPYRVQLGDRGDIFIRYCGTAAFHIDARASEVCCATADAAEPRWRRFLLDTVLATAALRRGYEAIHASAAADNGGVVAVVGPSGSGKSTVLAALLARGYAFFSDDVVAVEPASTGVLAHPGPPVMNVPYDRDVEGLELAAFRDERWMGVFRPAVVPLPLDAVILLERKDAAPLDVAALPPSPVPLLPHTLDSGPDPRRRDARFQVCGTIAESATLLRASLPLGVESEHVGDALDAALESVRA
jgi:hypothetical protein